MFQAVSKQALRRAQPTRSGWLKSFHSSAPARSKKCNPKDWKIVPTAPGNQDLVFFNKVDRTVTRYTPEGMTAAEIMQIPRAKKYLVHESVAEWYIKHMAEKKKRHREQGSFHD
ncbi:hypothetical protein BKA70DRAFT_1413194 [Coprinopsis sp. MPI-PUGE-AT-0042]|nr:hypothetical protein BKA70DRAFT_1413194 [Coprinopsis sp. MPI-PUGE-AT-0042]